MENSNEEVLIEKKEEETTREWRFPSPDVEEANSAILADQKKEESQ